MSEAGLDAAARSLRAWLNGQRFTDIPRAEATEFFTTSIRGWAETLGYHCELEAPLPPHALRPDRRGYLDVRLRHRSGKGRGISMEIDRGDKQLSLDKLAQAAELGDLCLWLRWGRRPVRLSVPPTVRVIRAHVLRRSTPAGPDRYSLEPDSCG
ncbi:hypothetical protein [Streptomyces sp. TLI_171]|uniref:hypothetical protein n=1 Tax=Streptomyces sp. TLI_171 TaxID=1938859 RepID=UPI000C180847|nr:hypothetical protein [Streptomyces sp. TLI_171]RKE17837.1 hypothetical protein BX266_1108 [Streptomyces sp. TLI_171]